jgi:hypothetical protein
MIRTTPTTARINRAIPSGIQIGASTHNHDQLITPQSLRVMNTIASNPPKPMPPEELVFESDILLMLLVIW